MSARMSTLTTMQCLSLSRLAAARLLWHEANSAPLRCPGLKKGSSGTPYIARHGLDSWRAAAGSDMDRVVSTTRAVEDVEAGALHRFPPLQPGYRTVTPADLRLGLTDSGIQPVFVSREVAFRSDWLRLCCVNEAGRLRFQNDKRQWRAITHFFAWRCPAQFRKLS